MKFYIAASITNKKATRALLQKLEKLSHAVTVDWTVEENIPPHERTSKRSRVTATAIRDFGGIKNSDVFVLLTEPAEGRSMYVELGIALACKAQSAKPLIFVMGKSNDQSIFYFHPLVKRVRSLEEIWRECAKETPIVNTIHVRKGRMEEFRALRAEMVEIIKDRIWGPATYSALAVGIFSFSKIDKDAIGFVFIIALSIPFLFHTVFREDSRMRMANYLSVVLEPRIPGMFWERYLKLSRSSFGENTQSGFLKGWDRFRHLISMTGLYFVIVVWAWYMLNQYTNSPIQQIIGFGLLIVDVFLISFFNRRFKFRGDEHNKLLDGRITLPIPD